MEVKGSGGSLLRFLLTGFAGMVLCLLLTALGAFYLSRRLVRGIVGPLDQLAKVAHTVRRERDFEKRVPEAGIAELSQLGEDFNALLDELESWQARLQDENASLAHQAHHDSLTSLPNRAFFEGRLSRALRDASEHREQLAVLFIDSDRFKEIDRQCPFTLSPSVFPATARTSFAVAARPASCPCWGWPARSAWNCARNSSPARRIPKR